MDDDDLLQRIAALTEEERALRARSTPFTGLDPATLARIRAIEAEIDSCWDQRRRRLAHGERTAEPPTTDSG